MLSPSLSWTPNVPSSNRMIRVCLPRQAFRSHPLYMTVQFLLVFLYFFYLRSVFSCFLTSSLLIVSHSETPNTDLRNLIYNVSILLLSSALNTHISLPYCRAGFEMMLCNLNCISFLTLLLSSIVSVRAIPLVC
jgi:hypothetical protein